MPSIASDASMALARFTIPFDMSGSPTITLLDIREPEP
jgi:hypothetical protein